MVKKNKLRYKNFNICQLVDKKKLKLHYLDEYKEHKKTYHKTKDNEMQNYILKHDRINLDNPGIHLDNISIPLFMNNIENTTYSYSMIKNKCSFVVIRSKETNEIQCYLSSIINIDIL